MSSLEYAIERAKGLYNGCRYPNLVEIHNYFPTGYFANVTEELMCAVFRGEEDLTAEEMRKIARYNGIPFSVLMCPKLITLDRGNYRHWKMMKQLQDKLYVIWALQKKGSKHADDYMFKCVNTGRGDYVNMDLDFRNGKQVTYGHYLGVRHGMDNIILFARNEFAEKPRGLNRDVKQKGGTV